MNSPEHWVAAEDELLAALKHIPNQESLRMVGGLPAQLEIRFSRNRRLATPQLVEQLTLGSRHGLEAQLGHPVVPQRPEDIGEAATDAVQRSRFNLALQTSAALLDQSRDRLLRLGMAPDLPEHFFAQQPTSFRSCRVVNEQLPGRPFRRKPLS